MENDDNVNRGRNINLWMIVSWILILVVGVLCFAYFFKPVPIPEKCDLNSSFNVGYSSGYNAGVGVAVNGTIQSLLYYSRNCSIVSLNVSNNVYGFLDVTCLNNKDAMQRILGSTNGTK